ncbi:MAG: hypothetical protein NTV11_20425 [Rhodocyclales bacterium]|nr:hypothetical protein [Rhodocyclales bacterium]
MNGFISMYNAACLLTGDSGTEDVENWLMLLIDQADELRAVKVWTDRRSPYLPGGLSFQRRPEQWRISVAAFRAWCVSNGFTLAPDQDTPSLPAADAAAGKAGGRRARQIARIVDEIKVQGWNALQVPYGGKQKIKAACLKETALFTEDGFTRAWQEAIGQGALRMEHHENYTSRK